MKASVPCPCGRGKGYAACCGRYHGGEPAPDAEALMRSRYSAYVVGDAAYLLATWHPLKRPPELGLDTACKWLGLEVKRHQPIDGNHATVEFVARFRQAGRGHRLHETSRFERGEAGRWFYVDGDLHQT